MGKVGLLRLPPDQRDFRPDPFPGSDKAYLKGCTCPAIQPWPGSLFIALECPVHELQRVTN
jgi:hypothetical protein